MKKEYTAGSGDKVTVDTSNKSIQKAVVRHDYNYKTLPLAHGNEISIQFGAERIYAKVLGVAYVNKYETNLWIECLKENQEMLLEKGLNYSFSSKKWGNIII
jgi:hypothetical protein